MAKRHVWIVMLALLVLPLLAQADEIRGKRHIYVWATDPVETADDVASAVPEMEASFELGSIRSIRSHCFSFAASNRAPGPHSVEVQWRKIGTAPGTGYARMFHRSLVLEVL